MYSDLDQRFLFVVGHGRSGTTLMQRALNCSPNIFMFGEANWQNFDPHAHGFADWYNSMHRSFKNPPSKGDRCPSVQGSLPDVLRVLAKSYKWTGDKIAFSHESLGYNIEKVWGFLYTHFPKARFILMIRDPDSVVISTQSMFPQGDGSIYVQSYIKSILSLANFYMSFDHAIVVDFSNFDATNFDKIGAWLGEDLSESRSEWQSGRSKREASVDLDGMADARHYYGLLSSLIDPTSLRITDRLKLRAIQQELHMRFDSESGS